MTHCSPPAAAARPLPTARLTALLPTRPIDSPTDGPPDLLRSLTHAATTLTAAIHWLPARGSSTVHPPTRRQTSVAIWRLTLSIAARRHPSSSAKAVRAREHLPMTSAPARQSPLTCHPASACGLACPRSLALAGSHLHHKRCFTRHDGDSNFLFSGLDNASLILFVSGHCANVLSPFQKKSSHVQHDSSLNLGFFFFSNSRGPLGTPKNGEHFIFPIADGTTKLSGRDHEVRQPRLWQDHLVTSQDLREEL